MSLGSFSMCIGLLLMLGLLVVGFVFLLLFLSLVLLFMVVVWVSLFLIIFFFFFVYLLLVCFSLGFSLDFNSMSFGGLCLSWYGLYSFFFSLMSVYLGSGGISFWVV